MRSYRNDDWWGVFLSTLLDLSVPDLYSIELDQGVELGRGEHVISLDGKDEGLLYGGWQDHEDIAVALTFSGMTRGLPVYVAVEESGDDGSPGPVIFGIPPGYEYVPRHEMNRGADDLKEASQFRSAVTLEAPGSGYVPGAVIANFDWDSSAKVYVDQTPPVLPPCASDPNGASDCGAPSSVSAYAVQHAAGVYARITLPKPDALDPETGLRAARILLPQEVTDGNFTLVPAAWRIFPGTAGWVSECMTAVDETLWQQFPCAGPTLDVSSDLSPLVSIFKYTSIDVIVEVMNGSGMISERLLTIPIQQL